MGEMLESVIRASPLEVVEGEFCVVRVTGDPPPGAFALMRDGVEVTAIVPADGAAGLLHDGIERGFTLVRARISTPFQTPGFLAAIASAVAAEGLNLLIVSTFSFDYFLVRTADRDRALEALRRRGFGVG